jgi:low affinity Fe/Cu permease
MAKQTTNPIVDQRLDRIETKIDKLAEAIVSIARAEEKLVSLENDKKFLMEKMIKMEERVISVEKKTDENTSAISIIQRITWIAISTAVAAAAGAYIHFGK